MKEEFEKAYEEFLTAKDQFESWKDRMNSARKRIEDLHELYQVATVKGADNKPWSVATVKMKVRLDRGREREFLQWLKETGRSDAIRETVTAEQLQEIAIPLIESGQTVPYVTPYNAMLVKVYKRGWKQPQGEPNV